MVECVECHEDTHEDQANNFVTEELIHFTCRDPRQFPRQLIIDVLQEKKTFADGRLFHLRKQNYKETLESLLVSECNGGYHRCCLCISKNKERCNHAYKNTNNIGELNSYNTCSLTDLTQ